ncbi:MAG: signal peptidase II [Actinomycetota bacterium]|nr:signal peptidase II [Actinomycetota bacterium]
MSDSDRSEGPDVDGAEIVADDPPEQVVAAALDEDAVASASWWRWCIVAGVALSVLAIDQLSKSWAVERLADGNIIDVVWTLRFKLAFNTGMAFSKGSGSGAIIGLVVLVVVVVLLFVARTMRSRVQLVLVGLIIGGALGNVLDRLLRAPLDGEPSGFMRGAVVDFIDVQWWPIWNVADMAVVVGAIALALFGLRAEPDDLPDDVPAAAGAESVPTAADDADAQRSE